MESIASWYYISYLYFVLIRGSLGKEGTGSDTVVGSAIPTSTFG